MVQLAATTVRPTTAKSATGKIFATSDAWPATADDATTTDARPDAASTAGKHARPADEFEPKLHSHVQPKHAVTVEPNSTTNEHLPAATATGMCQLYCELDLITLYFLDSKCQYG